MDAAVQVAIPEFDGRLITVPFSFKEPGPGAIPVYVADPRRARRVAGIAYRHAWLRPVPNKDKRIAVVLSSYPTRQSRVGNTVGLDTPASAVVLLRAMREAGYDLGDKRRGHATIMDPPGFGDPDTVDAHTVAWLAAIATGMATMLEARPTSASMAKQSDLRAGATTGHSRLVLLGFAVLFTLPNSPDTINVQPTCCGPFGSSPS